MSESIDIKLYKEICGQRWRRKHNKIKGQFCFLRICGCIFPLLAGSSKWWNQTLRLHGPSHYSVCLLGKLFHKMCIYVSRLWRSRAAFHLERNPRRPPRIHLSFTSGITDDSGKKSSRKTKPWKFIENVRLIHFWGKLSVSFAPRNPVKSCFTEILN